MIRLISLLLLVVLSACARPALPDPAALPLPPRDGMDPVTLAEIDRLSARLSESRGDAVAWAELAELLDAHDLQEAAMIAYSSAQALQPGNADWPYLRAHVALRRGEVTKARDDFARALALQPEESDILLAAASAAIATADFSAARDMVKAELERNPRNALALSLAGEAARGLGDHQSAAVYFEQALQVQPGATRLHHLLAAELRRLGRADLASQHQARAGDVAVESPDRRRDRVAGRAIGLQADHAAATAAFASGNFGSAAELWQRVLKARPGDISAQVGLGASLVRLGKPAEAQGILAAALQQQPDHALAHFNLASIAARAGNDSLAITHGEAALRSDPQLHDARFNLANALRRLGRGEEAEAHYLRIVEVQPNRASAWHAMAAAQASRGLWGEAAHTLEQGLARAPEDLGLRIARARLLAAAPLDSLRDAERARKEAQALLPRGGPLALEVLAMALAEQGQRRQAQQAAAQALLEAGRMPGFSPLALQRMQNLGRALEEGMTLRSPALD